MMINVNECEDNKVTIYYLGHSGWAVKTKSHFLIFDYFQGENNIDNKTINDGFINSEEIKDENAFVFVSHKHQDHYDKVIHQWKEQVKNIKYISGWNCGTDKFIGTLPHNKIMVEDVEILTIKSTDEGAGFLVKVDGVSIFHAGDHANWPDEDENAYCMEIDYIAQQDSNISIAFIPVTTFSGDRPESITKGAVYAIEKLKPSVVFPMHGNGREFLYKEFAKEEEVKNYNILCAENVGDSFQL